MCKVTRSKKSESRGAACDEVSPKQILKKAFNNSHHIERSRIFSHWHKFAAAAVAAAEVAVDSWSFKRVITR